MKEKIIKLKNMFFNKEFILFIVIGCINTLSTTILASLYRMILGDIQSFILGYVSGIFISYALNTLITFREKLTIMKLLKFAISTIPNFIIQMVVVYVGVKVIYLPSIICYGLAAVTGVPITFLLIKMYVFMRN